MTSAPVEFVIMMAVLISLVALSIDSMIPALPQIGHDLEVRNPNNTQLVLIVLFIGLSIGQLIYGPLSDSIGRKPAIYLGLIIFITGCVLSIFAVSFEMMLVGRLLQGFGAAGPRVVTVAMVRDLFEGRAMARVMSFVMMVFILIPTIAPALGQYIQYFFGWRAIFVSFLMLAIIGLFWFGTRQDETCGPDKQVPFSLTNIRNGIVEAFRNRAVFWYTVAAGFIFGSFIGFLVSAQQVFQQVYDTGTKFPLYFAFLSLAIGCASFFNGRVVLQYGMRALARWALRVMCLVSVVFWSYILMIEPRPDFWGFMVYMMMIFFCFGLLFANFQALAMEPLGHIAGTGAAVVSAFTTFISLILGTIIGQAYDGTILPLITGLLVLAMMSLWAMNRATCQHAR